MPYKVIGKCVHKYNPTTKKVGAVVPGGCHKSVAAAQSHKRALYANVEDVKKEVDMSSGRVQRRKKKMRSSNVTPDEVLKEQEAAEDQALLKIAEDEPLSDDEQALLEEGGEKVSKELEDAEEIEKDYYGAAGAKSWEEADQLKTVREQTEQLRKTAMTAEDMVYNILWAPEMNPTQKASAIKAVADGFGERAMSASKMKKETDSASNFVQQIKKAVGNVAKKIVGKPTIDDGGLLIEKDIAGDWRWVGWPSNKWKDREGEILRESAHEEYAEWVNKNMDVAPVFASWHVPGTARENPVDYVGYIDGFLVMSGKLTEPEAQALLTMQKEVDLGLSLGGIYWKDVDEQYVANHYVCHEVSELPLEKAANPFTEFTILEKEVDMSLKKDDYIKKLGGFMPEETQKAFLEKIQLKKEALEEAEVESKEVSTEEATQENSDFNYDEVKERLMKDLDVPGLTEFVKATQEAVEKVPILEAAVEALSQTNEELKKGNDEQLAEMISPPAKFPWSKRASQSEETVLGKEKDDEEEDKELEKAVPETNWLNKVTQTQPLTQ